MSLYPFKPSGQRIQGERGTTPINMAFLAHFVATPPTVSATAVLAATVLTDSVQNITTGITNPTVPCVLSIKGNQAGIAGNVVIEGKNMAGETITDTIALSGTSTVNGTKVFKTVTKITLPAKTNDGDTVSVGNTKLIGIPHKVQHSSCLLVKLFDGSTDNGSLTTSATALEGNYYTINGTPNGSRVLRLVYVVT